MAAEKDKIVIRGAREHNLKNIDVEIPRDRFVVITGLSGSGKSSLAFDTIYAEGQRRYVESLSAYARQFLGLMEKPDVDYIEGLSPAISIQQRTVSKNPRSTVGTVTEIYDYLRLLFARIGVPYCYKCGKRLEKQTVEQIVDAVLALGDGTRVQVLAPVVRGRKGEYREIFEEARRDGFVRVRVDGEVLDLDSEIRLDKNKKHNIEIVVDRLVVAEKVRKRLADSIETALNLASGLVVIDVVGDREMLFSEHYACVECGISYEEIEPRMFSFNSPYGACRECNGLGTQMVVDPELVVPNPRLTLRQGALAPWGEVRDGWYATLLKGVADHYGFSLDTPWEELPEKIRHVLLYGSGDEEIEFLYASREGKSRGTWINRFEGVIPNLERRYHTTESASVREWIEGFMRTVPCPACGGARLRPEALSIKIAEHNIHDVTRMSVR
ncbi:MAG TPA: excinuclease ABC subunit UvrA, partial [Bacteroidetes bacterium]|nr:excinuclease ABC subunit UvrA [Bacteroidota bacterium]